jgi:GDP/UDP-N,N'-diacetylbacillosamine 2-epimerase (hydrolysing)
MSTTTPKICVVTGTRAEYGLLRSVIQGIQDSEELQLQLIVTGMHLSPEFGFTVHEIDSDGFPIDRKIEILLSSDTPVGITKSMGLAMISFADALADLRPDLLLVLGDRFEIFCAAASATIARVPVAHLHGGELTLGAIDESIRHSVTKMSHLHFVAADEYRQRVIQLGEHPDRVFLVGGLGVDSIRDTKILDREELSRFLEFNLFPRNLLITFHPVTLEGLVSAEHLDSLLHVLADLHDVGLIFTMPNADAEGRLLASKIRSFCEQHSNARAYTSLGQLRYLTCVHHFDGVIGNSSSGLTEVPSFQRGTVNIGTRQDGRLKASSVIDCSPDSASIRKAISLLFSSEFQLQLPRTQNPYGDGGASSRIIKILEEQKFETLLQKRFYDLPFC